MCLINSLSLNNYNLPSDLNGGSCVDGLRTDAELLLYPWKQNTKMHK